MHAPLHLIRIAETFSSWLPEIVSTLGLTYVTSPAKEYHLVREHPSSSPRNWHSHPAAACVRWSIPIHHSWPCHPSETAQFIEKAAQALAKKFSHLVPQTILCGTMEPGEPNGYYRRLASNLRGRVLQLFPNSMVAADEQNPGKPTLFCLVGKQGLLAGIATPRDANGFHPGGTRFIRQNDPAAISRAGAKIAEALHYLALYCPLPGPSSHWLELGASPGGMTAELLTRGYRVTAVDRAPLDPRLHNHPQLRFLRADASEFDDAGATYDAILSDMNGPPKESLRLLLLRASSLRPGGLVIFTLKLAAISSLAELFPLETELGEMASQHELHRIARTHLTYNRNEFTWFLTKNAPIC